MKKVSVVIPFHNDLGALQKCLQALEKQSYPAGDLEVIAVDNGSTKNLDKIQAAFARVRWLREPTAGSYSARNRGVKEAQGEVIAFTDADCLPDPSWLQEAVAALARSRATLIAGRIDYLNPTERKLNIYELFEIEFFRLTQQRQMIERLGVAATANVVTHRAVFDRVGFFNPNLKSLGDGEWIKRATAKGEILRYADSAVVLHPRRSTFSAIFRKVRRIAGGRIMLMKKQRESAPKFAFEVYRYSFLNPRMHRYAVRFPGVEGWAMRLQMFLLIEFLGWANPIERLRVILGGRSFRG